MLLNFLRKKIKNILYSWENDGYAYKKANYKILIPMINKKLVTPYSEAFQAVIWHCLVSHPKLQEIKTKW